MGPCYSTVQQDPLSYVTSHAPLKISLIWQCCTVCTVIQTSLSWDSIEVKQSSSTPTHPRILPFLTAKLFWSIDPWSLLSVTEMSPLTPGGREVQTDFCGPDQLNKHFICQSFMLYLWGFTKVNHLCTIRRCGAIIVLLSWHTDSVSGLFGVCVKLKKYKSCVARVFSSLRVCVRVRGVMMWGFLISSP